MNYLKQFFNFSKKIIVVTGGSGQLGAQICKAFVSLGAAVVSLDKLKPKRPVKSVIYCQLDISQKREVVATFSKIFERYKRVDILINNAGVSVFEPFEERMEESIDFVMDINLKGTLFCIQDFVCHFDAHKQKSGVIINIASLYGVISPDYRIYTDCLRKNSEIYGATKAGVIQMTKYFAVHLANRNIRVNAVSPGGIFNPENPQGKDFVKNYSFRCPAGRMAEVSEILGAVFYLAGNASTYTTGHNIVIDGGTSCW